MRRVTTNENISNAVDELNRELREAGTCAVLSWEYVDGFYYLFEPDYAAQWWSCKGARGQFEREIRAFTMGSQFTRQA